MTTLEVALREVVEDLLRQQAERSLADPTCFETHSVQGQPRGLRLMGLPVEVNDEVPLDEIWLRDANDFVFRGKVP